MINTQCKDLIKLEMDDYNTSYNDVNSTDLREIEFEIITSVDFSDKRKVEIYNGIIEVDERLALINQKVEELNIDIDRLMNHADGVDYTIAVASGIISAAIDIVYVGEFSFDRGKEWSHDKVNNFVMAVAKKNGFDPETYRGKDPLKGAIKFLEDKYHIPSDGVWNSDHYGINAKSHHLDDWAHHPSILGLIASIITQFTQTGYFSNKYGENIKIDVPILLQRKKNGYTDTIMLIGNDIPSKLFCGVVNWAMHLVSDMAGSSDNPGFGMGIPGPIITLLKELSAIPGVNKISLPKIIGDFFENNRFDLRSELAVGYELGRQSIPIIVNESLVRGFYFISRLIYQIKEKESLKDIEWKKTLPFKNRTIVRMMTIATGTFMAIDLADAGIRAVIESGGFNTSTVGDFVLRVNFVGIGRFAIAVGTDTGMGIKKSKVEEERIRLRGEQLQLLNAKVFYKEADMWIEAENTANTIEEAYIIMEKVSEDFIDTWNEIKEGSQKRREYIDKIKENDDNFTKDLSDLLEWG